MSETKETKQVIFSNNTNLDNDAGQRNVQLYREGDKFYLETTLTSNGTSLPPIKSEKSSNQAIDLHSSYLSTQRLKNNDTTKSLKESLSEHFSEAELNKFKEEVQDISLFDVDQTILSNTNQQFEQKDNENHTESVLENKNYFSNQDVDKAIQMDFDKEDVQQIMELQKLREQNKEISPAQKQSILENPNLTDERKLVLLTFLNDPTPEASIKEHYAKLSSDASKKMIAEHGRDLHNGMEQSKDGNLKKNAKNLANGVEKISRFTVD